MGELDNGVFIIQKIEEQKNFGADAGTETIDLPTSNYLNSLILRIQNTNGATSNTGVTIATSITRIEVVADGVPVYSVTGEMARTLAHFDIGKLPPYDESQVGAAVQYAIFPIIFGQDDDDKEFILPAHKFASLQLKIEYSFTDSGTAGYATSETNAKYDLLTKVLVHDSLIDTPFLKKKEVFSATLNTVQEEEVELGVGAGHGAIRRIFMRAYEADIEDGVDIDKYELVVNDSQRLIDQRWLTSQAEDAMRYNAKGDKTALVSVANASTGTWNSKVSNIRGVQVTGSTAGSANLVLSTDALAGDLVSFDSEDTAAEPASVTVIGDGVPFATVIDLGTDDISDSLDIGKGSGISNLKIKLNVATVGAATKVVTEEVVFY